MHNGKTNKQHSFYLEQTAIHTHTHTQIIQLYIIYKNMLHLITEINNNYQTRLS